MKLEEDKLEKFNIFILVILVFYSLIVARLFYLQILQNNYYKGMSENNRIKLKRIEGPRGKIYDTNGKLLVTNKIGYRLVYLKGRVYTKETVKKIALLVNETTEVIEKRITQGEIYKYTGENVIVEDLEENMAHSILERLEDYPYLDVTYYPKRKYLYGTLASNVIGYVKAVTEDEYEKLKDKGYTKKDIVGKKGIEKFYDNELKGRDGYESIEVDATNRLRKRISQKEAVSGNDLYLTIDIELQMFMMEQYKDKKGGFVALDVRNGNVITMVSAPEYDLNKMTSKITQDDWNKLLNNDEKPMQNRVTVGRYPPGSIYKVITSLAILETGIGPEDSVYDPGYFKLGSWRWNCWKLDGHGTVNLERSIQESCDTYFYTMADRIGKDKIIEVAKRFKLNEKTGIDIPEEKVGIVPSDAWKRKTFKEQWYRGDTINLSIGQGYALVTPIEMGVLYSTFANRGFSYKPHIGQKVVDLYGKEKKIEPEIGLEISTKKEYIDIINEGLRKVVSNGTGMIVKLRDIEVAGKTGSAENAHYNLTHGWFAGFAPYEKPEIVVIAFVEGGGHGGSVAAPIAKAFIEKYYSLKKERSMENVK